MAKVLRSAPDTPDLINRDRQLYAEGQSLTAIGKQLGVEASTIGKALKRAGVKLRAAGCLIAGIRHVTIEH